jgi:transposase
MGEVITIGLDIAKSVFQVHGVDGLGAVVIRTERTISYGDDAEGSDRAR